MTNNIDSNTLASLTAALLQLTAVMQANTAPVGNTTGSLASIAAAALASTAGAQPVGVSAAVPASNAATVAPGSLAHASTSNATPVAPTQSTGTHPNTLLMQLATRNISMPANSEYLQWHVVTKGRVPGVYLNSAEVTPLIHGVSGFYSRKCATQGDAWMFYKGAWERNDVQIIN